MSIKTITIEWTGPYTKEQIDQIEDSNGIYLIAGSRKGPVREGILYVGITGREFRKRLSKNEHGEIDKAITKPTRNYWLGKSNYLRRNRGKSGSVTFEDVEHLIIRYLCLEYGMDSLINRRKKKSNPKRSVGIINAWKFKESKKERIREKYTAQSHLANIILYDSATGIYHYVEKENKTLKD